MWANIDSETWEKYKTRSWEDWQKYKVEYREWFEKGGEAAVEQAKQDREAEERIQVTWSTLDLKQKIKKLKEKRQQIGKKKAPLIQK